MSIDPRAFAQLICGYCLEVQPGQQVLITSTSQAEEALLEIQDRVLARGAWPILRVSLPDQEARWLRSAEAVHLDSFAPVEETEMRSIDSYLNVQAPALPGSLSDIDPRVKARRDAARAPLTALRLSKRWCSTLWPTQGSAEAAGMDLDSFQRFVSKAMFLDKPDPVEHWGLLRERQASLIAGLAGAREVHIVGPGTDLKLSVAGRTWINSDGKRNMPSGEVFTGPHESSAEGHVHFALPTVHLGTRAKGVTLRFRDGIVVESDAEEGREYLSEILAVDEGAKRIGELGIGTNLGIDRSIGNILFDEKMGGTIHLALGRSYPETGGSNLSAVHWDLICDLRTGGEIRVDGVPLDLSSYLAQP